MPHRFVFWSSTGLALSMMIALGACGSSSDSPFDMPSATEPTEGGTPGSSGQIGSSGGVDSGPGGQCAATVSTAKPPEVDIIIAIDTSGSMDEETAQVQQNINTFANNIGTSGLDYRVIMIASKPVNITFPIPITTLGICVPPPLGGPGCTDNPPRFHHLDQHVDSLDSLVVLLSKYPSYSPWLRPSAFKVFIEVTDDNSQFATADFFDQKLVTTASDQFGTATARRYVFNSICGYKRGTPILSSTYCPTAENIGEQYQRLSQLTGGVVDSVCETSYESVFSNIATGLVARLGCDFAYPKSETGTEVDPTKIVVRYTAGTGGAPKDLAQVTDKSKCGSFADAWYYDDNANPSRIIFCPATCAGPGADTGGKVEIAAGCAAPPPR